VVPDFPEMGSALPVNLYKPVGSRTVAAQFPRLQNQALALPELPALGSWVKLKNVLVVVVEGQLQVPSSLPPPTHIYTQAHRSAVHVIVDQIMITYVQLIELVVPRRAMNLK